MINLQMYLPDHRSCGQRASSESAMQCAILETPHQLHSVELGAESSVHQVQEAQPIHQQQEDETEMLPSQSSSMELFGAFSVPSSFRHLHYRRQGIQGGHQGTSKEQLIIQSIFGESSGIICLPQARSTNSPIQLPFIPRQVRGQFLKHG